MQGDVELTLDAKPVVLKSTLGAAIEIDERLGGFAEAFRQLAGFKLGAFTIIVAAGMGRRPNEVKEAVYRSGMADLIAPLTEYLTLLSNGGRAPPAVEEAARTGEG